MSKDLTQLRGDYVSALETYLKDGSEAHLSKAYSLGRRAMNDGLGVLDIADIHADALRDLVVRAPRRELARHAVAAATFFCEVLSPFEMSHLGYFAENDELRRLNEAILQQKEHLRVSEQRYRRLAENAPDIVLCYELYPSLHYTYVSPVVIDITGYSPYEYYSDPDLGFNVVHPEDRHLVERLWRGEVTARSTLTLRWVHKNGSLVWIEQKNVPVQDPDNRVVAVEAICRDITERRKLEEQFRQAQKLESVGRLAAGVAHDFNNLLTVINGYTEMAIGEAPDESEIRKNMVEVREAGQRATQLTQQLLAFSRKQLVEPSVLNINTAILELRKMLQRLIGEDIDLRIELDPDLGNVLADAGQIEQILMNLVVNSRDAMPDGGSLRVETGNAFVGPNQAQELAEGAPGPHVTLAVTDTGCGMPPEVRARIFEPFYTTKPQGVGTGLGLATVYGIVKQARGWIQVESQVGEGSTFRVFLPRVEEPVAQASAAPKSDDVRGTETILVVEDEAEVRNIAVRSLKRLGYRVFDAGSPEAALSLIEALAEPIHLLVTDMIMPGMNGVELADKAKARIAGLRVLFVSGYTDSVIGRHSLAGSGALFLRKPFTPDSLGQKVRETLGPRQVQDGILLVGEDDALRGIYRRLLSDAGYRVFEAIHSAKAIEVLASASIGLVIMNLKPGRECLEPLEAIRRENFDPRVILLSGSFDNEALSRSSNVYARLQEPIDHGELLRIVRSALEKGGVVRGARGA